MTKPIRDVFRYVTRYRAYPSKEVQDTIFEQFGILTELRNKCLDYKNWDVGILKDAKRQFPKYSKPYSIVTQNLLFGIRDNLKGLKKAKEKGRKVGKLRHKLVRSMTYEQSGFKVTQKGITFSKIGEIPVIFSRKIPGTIKQIAIKFTRTHEWYVTVISEQPGKPESCDEGRFVGIDMNLTVFSHDSDDHTEPHPHNVRMSAKQLGRAQRKMSRKVKGGHNRKKQRLKVARIHQTVENRRDDFLHKWANEYVYQSNYSLIAVEKLNISKMLDSKRKLKMSKARSRAMRRNMSDAAWGKARTFLKYKAASAGISIVEVDPAYTSQTCSNCGHILKDKLELEDQTFVCPVCGYTANRNLNSARNILKRALVHVGRDTPEYTPVEIRTNELSFSATPVNIPAQVLVCEADNPVVGAIQYPARL